MIWFIFLFGPVDMLQGDMTVSLLACLSECLICYFNVLDVPFNVLSVLTLLIVYL